MSDNKQKETPNGYDLERLRTTQTSQPPSLGLGLRLGGASGMLFGLALTSGDDKNSPFKEATCRSEPSQKG